MVVDSWVVPDGSQEEFTTALIALIARLQEVDALTEGQILRGVDPTRFLSWVRFVSAQARDRGYLDEQVGELRRRIGQIAGPRPHSYTVLQRFPPRDP
jgi:hypothetical protein